MMNSTNTQDAQDLHFLGQLKTIQESSKANKRKVGAIIGQAFGSWSFWNYSDNAGYNQNQLIGDCEDSDGKTFENVIHAEAAAIIEALKNIGNDNKLQLSKATIYCTYSPCMDCCKLIVLSGIKRLVYCDEHPVNFKKSVLNGSGHYSPYDYLVNSGVEVVRVLDADIIHFK